MGEVQKGDGGGDEEGSLSLILSSSSSKSSLARPEVELRCLKTSKKKSEVQFLIEATEREENINSDTCRNPQNKE